MDFEKCNFYAWLKHGERVPDPSPNTYSERGTMIHTAAEKFVMGEADLIPELSKFEVEFSALRTRYKAGKVSLEGEWGFDTDWKPVDWKLAWGRMKLDALNWLSDKHALVIDYKSGKRFGNEIKHGEQMQLYQLGTLLRYPQLDRVDVELWYTDVDDMVPISFTRAEGLQHLEAYDKRARKMTEAEFFPPRPNIFSCARCPYGPSGTGHCKVGVTQHAQFKRKGS